MATVGLQKLERRHLLVGLIRALGTSALVVATYFVIPINDHRGASIALRLVSGLAIFTAVLVYEVRAILRSAQPVLRAVHALALVIPFFLIVFAWTYLTMALSAPESFNEPLDRVPALYFTVTTFATVGYGDIHPVTGNARMVVTVQMLSDLIVIGVVVRVIIEAARRTATRSDER